MEKLYLMSDEYFSAKFHNLPDFLLGLSLTSTRLEAVMYTLYCA